MAQTEKRVFAKVEGVEVSIDYINNFGNKVAVNIDYENGLKLDDPIITDDLKIKIMKNVTFGNLEIREVEVKGKPIDENKVFIDKFEEALGKKVESKSTTTSAPKKVEQTPPTKQTKQTSTHTTKKSTPPTKKETDK